MLQRIAKKSEKAFHLNTRNPSFEFQLLCGESTQRKEMVHVVFREFFRYIKYTKIPGKLENKRSDSVYDSRTFSTIR